MSQATILFRGLSESTILCTDPYFNSQIRQRVRIRSTRDLLESPVGTWLLRHSSVQNLYVNDSENFDVALSKDSEMPIRFLAISLKQSELIYHHYLLALFPNSEWARCNLQHQPRSNTMKMVNRVWVTDYFETFSQLVDSLELTFEKMLQGTDGDLEAGYRGGEYVNM